MVPLELLPLKHQHCYDCEYSEGDYFLDNLQLKDVERSSVVFESYPVCRDHEAVFDKGYTP